MTRFSIVIPTHQRREIVTRNVSAFAAQTTGDFEVIVVVDGATDGTAAALRRLGVPFRLSVIEQDNQGAGAARNAGAGLAQGEILLFLDDDMEAGPGLLLEHGCSFDDGADLVLGHLPVHPESPRTLLSRGLGWWARDRLARLSEPAATVQTGDLLTGQMSVRRASFEELGGFDAGLTRQGLFGGEDIDFGYRVMSAGLRVVFNPAAVSHQYFDVDPSDYLRRWREAGRAGAELVAKHPDRAAEVGALPPWHTRRSRILLGALGRLPPAASAPLTGFAAHLVRSRRMGDRTRRLFFALRTMEAHRGARSARRALDGQRTVVLAYHAVSDLCQDPVLAPYGVPPALLARQLDALAAHGRRFVDLQTVIRGLDGREVLPRGAVLVTFDDGYKDLLTAALPVLAVRGIPAVVFAVTARIGATNAWDDGIGATTLELLDADELGEVAARGIEVGSHGATHRSLPGLPAADLEAELRGSAAALRSAGLPEPAAFSYPFGEWAPGLAAAWQTRATPWPSPWTPA